MKNIRVLIRISTSILFQQFFTYNRIFQINPTVVNQIIEYIQDMQQQMQAQAQKIMELDNRINKIEQHLNLNQSKIVKINDLSDHPRIDIKQLSENTFQLTRIEAGSVAFIVIKQPLQWMQLRFMDQEQEQRPQFVYFGFTDSSKVDLNYTEQNYFELDRQILKNSYLINTSGKAKVPDKQWDNVEPPLLYQLQEASKMLITNSSCALDLCLDDGLQINCFTKTFQNPLMVVGIFGEGTIELKCRQ